MKKAAKPEGMVDTLDSFDAGPSPAEIEFVTASMQPGRMPVKLIARALDPRRKAAREAIAADRRANDWARLNQYRDANKALAGQPVKAVFIGDSLTEFWAAAEPEFFTDGIVGRGISGQTSPQILVRFMADAIALKPRVIHLLCGGNDVAGNTGPNTPQDYKNNVIAMLTLAKAHGISMIIGSLTPCANFAWASRPDPRPRLHELNRWLKGQTLERGLVWADYHSALRAEDGSMPAEYSRDGLHANLLGYAVMRPVARAALAMALG